MEAGRQLHSCQTTFPNFPLPAFHILALKFFIVSPFPLSSAGTQSSEWKPTFTSNVADIVVQQSPTPNDENCGKLSPNFSNVDLYTHVLKSKQETANRHHPAENNNRNWNGLRGYLQPKFPRRKLSEDRSTEFHPSSKLLHRNCAPTNPCCRIPRENPCANAGLEAHKVISWFRWQHGHFPPQPGVIP